jgi:hypothetical protein
MPRQDSLHNKLRLVQRRRRSYEQLAFFVHLQRAQVAYLCFSRCNSSIFFCLANHSLYEEYTIHMLLMHGDDMRNFGIQE